MALTTARESEVAIVLIPGSHSTVAMIYEPVISSLRSKGYKSVIGADLLSVCTPDNQRFPPATLKNDAQHIRRVLLDLLSQGKDIVMVMCSFGGFPGTEALKGLPSRGTMSDESQCAGPGGSIIGLLYLSSFLPCVGDSLANLANQPLLELGTYGSLAGIPASAVFPEWSQSGKKKEMDYHWSQIGTQSADSMQGQVTHDLWNEGVFKGKIMYAIGKDDATIPSALRNRMIEQVNSKRQDKVLVREFSGAGHLMVLERSEEVVSTLEELISIINADTAG